MQLHGFSLELSESETNPRLLDDASQDNFFLIIQKQSLLKLFEVLCCPHCKQSGLSFDIDQQKGMGFAAFGSVCCRYSQKPVVEGYLSDRVGGIAATEAPLKSMYGLFWLLWVWVLDTVP